MQLAFMVEPRRHAVGIMVAMVLIFIINDTSRFRLMNDYFINAINAIMRAQM